MPLTQNYINHIALAVDASSSMSSHKNEVIKVVDGIVAHLAARSKELDQETRVTVYTFADQVTNLVYDKDVLRMPSIRDSYKVYGNTALLDASLKALSDLGQTPELYGDHAFLAYVVTDGQNNIGNYQVAELQRALNSLKANWTMACLVPDARGVYEAKKFGFQPNNIAIWDTSSVNGVESAGRVITQSTDKFMTGRSSGARGYTNSLFLDTSNVPAAKVTGQLEALHPGQFRLLPVTMDGEAIAPFVERYLGYPYRLGMAYYQISKSEKVQPQKGVAIRDKKTHQLYVGPHARQILGLPDYECRVAPSKSPEYDVFIQSTSVNRKLVEGTSVLLLS